MDHGQPQYRGLDFFLGFRGLGLFPIRLWTPEVCGKDLACTGLGVGVQSCVSHGLVCRAPGLGLSREEWRGSGLILILGLDCVTLNPKSLT